MLRETQEKQEKLKNQHKILAIQNAKKKWIKVQTIKWIKISLITISIILIVFFPIQSGNIIGNWLHDFFGTIYKNCLK
jgi:ACR3 family arsenite efflux pump ArsB